MPSDSDSDNDNTNDLPVPNIVRRIRAAADNGAAFLPVHARFGVRAVGADIGRVEVAQRMGPYCLDRHGQLSPGAFLVGADTVLGSAVASRLTDDLSVVSLTMHMQFVRLDPGAADGFLLRARAAHIGDGCGTATGEITDDAGRLLAHMSTQCAYAPMATPPPVTAGTAIDISLMSPVPASPDDTLSALATVRAGARVTVADGHELRVTATSTPDMCNSRGDIQGGVLALLAEQAVSASLIRSTPLLAGAESMDLTINFLRPLRPDRPHLEIVARPDHAGRRFAVAHAVGRDDTGRAVVSASGSRYRG